MKLHLGFIILFFCALLNVPLSAQFEYQKEINDWHAKRIKGLAGENGWLNLVGLYWLSEGKNSFGSGKNNKIVFPAGTIDANAGYFERVGTTVKLVTSDNVDVKVNGITTKEAIIFHKDSLRPAVVSINNLRFTIIKREDKIGIRLRDLKSQALAEFKGVNRFPVDSAWNIQAVLQSEPQIKSIPITNVLGQTNEQKTPGKLWFSIGGKKYSLDALEEGEELFIIFGDATSGETTYPSGRFLYAKKPGADGKTFIDFNKAYNPPCAFTDYATCPLPPKQNILSIAITAGEKNYGHHSAKGE